MSRRSNRRATGPLARDAWSYRRKWPWLVLILLIVTIIAASSGDYGLFRLFRLRAAHDRILERNHELQADNTRLEQDLRRLREDRHIIEKIAREELGMVKADEIVYQVTP